MPTAEQTIVERLRLCYLDIEGVNSATELLISGGPSDGILPFVETGIGPSTTTRISESSWDVTEQFIGTAYLTKINSANTPDKGAQSLVNALPYVARFRRYFMEHGYLDTTTLERLSLPHIRPVLYQQLTELTNLDGNAYGFQFQITITWREFRS